MIEHLSPLTPNPRRTSRVLTRCHERLARQRRRHDRRKQATTVRAVVVGLAAIQLIAIAATALSVYTAF